MSDRIAIIILGLKFVCSEALKMGENRLSKKMENLIKKQV
jgi:hypothetical protein